jgi:hypothetical protein
MDFAQLLHSFSLKKTLNKSFTSFFGDQLPNKISGPICGTSVTASSHVGITDGRN